MKNKYLLIILAIVIFCSASFVALNKPPIEEATVDDIQAIQGIGEVLSLRIVNYLDNNPNADIDDLINIEGIGEIKLKQIRREFK